MDYCKKLLVEPGAKVRLADVDPGFRTGDAKHEARAELEAQVRLLSDLQLELYAEHERALLVVLQGLDASGKDGTIRHVLTGFNPQGCKVVSFKTPTSLERDHDFLWRVHTQAPARGEVAIFNRSHYEDVLVARVHRLVPKPVWSRRFDMINQFERLLCLDNRTTIVKLFLHISKDAQLERFQRRIEDPLRHWKVSESDYEERRHWDEYVAAFEDVLERTSTREAPWYIVPADHKWFRNLAVSHILVETLQAMKLELPQPSVDLERARALLREAEREAGHP